MRLKEKDLLDFARLFKDLSNGKYKIAVIDAEEKEYLYDMTLPPEDGFDKLALQTIIASLNEIIVDRPEKQKKLLLPMPKDKIEKRVKETSIYNNPYLWKTISKKPQ